MTQVHIVVNQVHHEGQHIVFVSSTLDAAYAWIRNNPKYATFKESADLDGSLCWDGKTTYDSVTVYVETHEVDATSV